jgi:hypothetical protein
MLTLLHICKHNSLSSIPITRACKGLTVKNTLAYLTRMDIAAKKFCIILSSVTVVSYERQASGTMEQHIFEIVIDYRWRDWKGMEMYHFAEVNLHQKLLFCCTKMYFWRVQKVSNNKGFFFSFQKTVLFTFSYVPSINSVLNQIKMRLSILAFSLTQNNKKQPILKLKTRPLQLWVLYR